MFGATGGTQRYSLNCETIFPFQLFSAHFPRWLWQKNGWVECGKKDVDNLLQQQQRANTTTQVGLGALSKPRFF